MSGIKPGGFEQWMREHTRKVRLLEGNVAKAKLPWLCTSTQRPDPTVIAVGVRLFETDTNRSIFVNAAQSGYVDSLGNALA